MPTPPCSPWSSKTGGGQRPLGRSPIAGVPLFTGRHARIASVSVRCAVRRPAAPRATAGCDDAAFAKTTRLDRQFQRPTSSSRDIASNVRRVAVEASGRLELRWTWLTARRTRWLRCALHRLSPTPCSRGLNAPHRFLDCADTTGWHMDGDLSVGDMVQLPSGLVFKVTFALDPERPWRAVQVGRDWRVSRVRPQGGVMYFYGGRTAPMTLNQADAEAVAAVLNRVRNS